MKEPMSSRALQLLQEPTQLSVSSFDSATIVYDLYDAPSRTAVLVVPGFWRDRRYPSMQRLAAFLTTHGFKTAICDLRGHGDSEGIFGFNLTEHYDIAAVAKDLASRPSIDSITLLGFSYGGAIAISAAARHELPLAALLLISPVADFSRLSPRINPFTIHRHIAFGQALRRPRFDWRFARSPKLNAIDDITSVNAPLCLVHVKNDWLVDHSHSVALYEAANEPKELHIIDIPGNYHADRIFNVAADEVDPIIAEFLGRTSARQELPART
jgi:alpha-beta hydrolase superfamily lysophospholipase